MFSGNPWSSLPMNETSFMHGTNYTEKKQKMQYWEIWEKMIAVSRADKDVIRLLSRLSFMMSDCPQRRSAEKNNAEEGTNDVSVYSSSPFWQEYRRPGVSVGA